MKRTLQFMLLIVFVLCMLSGCSTSAEKAADTHANTSAAQDVSEKTSLQENDTQENESAALTETNQQNSESINTDNKNSNILVVYFSATGTTKKAAESIADTLAADIYEIEPAVPYSSDDINYNVSDCRANLEQNDPSSRPEIANLPENLDGYDAVLIGYPIWWGVEPKIIDTFAEKYDFTGKTVSVFCTSGGSSVGASESSLKNIINAEKWINGERIQDGTTSYTDSILKNMG